jgi:hypothetical protein
LTLEWKNVGLMQRNILSSFITEQEKYEYLLATKEIFYTIKNKYYRTTRKDLVYNRRKKIIEQQDLVYNWRGNSHRITKTSIPASLIYDSTTNKVRCHEVY